MAHVIFRLAIGGLENGLVNLINNMPPKRYRHCIICISESTAFKGRLQGKEIPVIELKKQPGHDFGVYVRFRRILHELKPDIVHTRNLPALEFQCVAALSGIKGRVHGEHGWDMYDLEGRNKKYNMLRKVFRPFVQHYIPVSRDLERWLIGTIGIAPRRVSQIYNGVKADRFYPCTHGRQSIGPAGFMDDESFVLGTVGRMEAVKDQLTLARAFVQWLKADSEVKRRARLVMIGDGSCRQEVLNFLQKAHAEDLAWLPGERNDVAEIMRGLDLFVLPSLREGISNTILEAMATGLPIVATRVGGNPELISENQNGLMVPPSDPTAMLKAIQPYFLDPRLRRSHGSEGRRKVESFFSMDAMVAGYLEVYDSVLDPTARQNAQPILKSEAEL